MAPIVTAITLLDMTLELQVPEGITLTVLPMSERWLRADSDRQHAVQQIRGRHKQDQFRSLMDYLYANVFYGTFKQVRAYYNNAGPPLRDLFTREQRYALDCYLVEALKIAYAEYCADRERTWSQVRGRVRLKAA